jgi:hypothetical protein
VKTTLKQQLDLVNAMNAEVTKPGQVRLLRAFLNDHGYEKVEDCKHHTIVRVTGKCTTCGVPVVEPMPTDSDESLFALRDRLRG